MTGGSDNISRCIRLRRPATLSVMDEPHVPDVPAAKLAEVQWRWEALCRDNPRYFDGRVYHVLGVHRNGYGGAVIHVADCAYRYVAVQNDGFDLGVRHLGVKGITIRDGKVLLGRRAMTVASYRGLWEFAPAGVVEPPRHPAAVVAAELAEETGLKIVGEPTPIAVLYDETVRCWEIIFRLTAENAGSTGDRVTDEYDEIVWCEPSGLPPDLSPIARRMIPLL
ncbi:MAG: NUDIX domain-containing protein [Phycisphaerales bacterium]|nr:MAG: NUDIX domain-containing protein [Phycisphaerales bacterium]